MKKCSEYCGVACTDGSCPNALREENPEYYEMCYGTLKKTQCRHCAYNHGCEDCCIAFYSDRTVQQCQSDHGLRRKADDPRP